MKYLISIFFIINFLTASEIELNYDVEFGTLFGGSGEAKVIITKEDSNYSIILKAITKGYLKKISANRVEIYESHGKIENNIFIPNKFIIKRVNNFKTKIDTYIFNHKEKKINIEKVRFSENKRVEFEDKSKFYAKNDILTLLFNLKFLLNKKINYEFYAIGANKSDGKIEVEVKEGKPKVVLDIIMNKKELKDSNFFITLNEEFFPLKLLLKDMDFFGDVKAILKERK